MKKSECVKFLMRELRIDEKQAISLINQLEKKGFAPPIVERLTKVDIYPESEFVTIRERRWEPEC